MRHAVVTGSSSGIGEAIARRLLAGGWRVTGLDRAPPVIAEPAFEPVRVDLTDETARAAAIGAARRRDRDRARRRHHARRRRSDRSMRPRARRCGDCMSAAPARSPMRSGPDLPAGGRIVLIGSLSSRGVAGRSQYAATKAALVALARSWAVELLQRGVTVNVVSPATTATAMLADPARNARRARGAADRAADPARRGRGAHGLSAVRGGGRHHRPGDLHLRRRDAARLSVDPGLWRDEPCHPAHRRRAKRQGVAQCGNMPSPML